MLKIIFMYTIFQTGNRKLARYTTHQKKKTLQSLRFALNSHV